jgi:hypothetical protein
MSQTAPAAAPANPQGEHRPSPFEVGQRTIKEIIADLSKPINEKLLKTRQQGGKDIKYVPWHTVVKMLDYRAPGWTYEITHMIHLPGRTAMSVRITIPASMGQDAQGNNVIQYYYRDASGTEKDDTDSYGDPVSNAESMALRRAAAKFGVGLGLYGTQQNQSSGGGSGQQGNNPPPISQKQLGYARTLAGERNMDENTLARQQYKKDLVDCNVVEAKAIIEKLLATPKPLATGGGGYDESVF